MSTLFGNNISQTYQGLIKLANSTTGVTATTQSLQDGLGNNIPIQVSTDTVNISGSFLVNGQPVSFTNTGSFATTGSNTFFGDQTIVGNITLPSSSFISTTNTSGALYLSSLNGGFLGLNTDGGEGDVFIGYGPNNTHIRGNTDITGSLGVSNIKGTGSLFLQPNQDDVRFLEIYNTSPTDTHITASGGQIYLGDDVTYVKVDNYGSVERIDVVAGNELVVSSSVINLTGSLYQSGTFYSDQIDVSRGNIVEGTGSYIATFNNNGILEYDTYSNIAGALSPYINRNGLITTGSIGETQSITGSLDISDTITANSASFNYLYTIYETASIIYSSGSNQLGDELTDTQTLSGSVQVQGELLVNGVPVVTGSVNRDGLITTGSLDTTVQTITGSLYLSGAAIGIGNPIDNDFYNNGANPSVVLQYNDISSFFSVTNPNFSQANYSVVDTGYTYDNEFNIILSSGSIKFQEYNQDRDYNYRDWLQIKASTSGAAGIKPIQLLRNTEITGSLIVSGSQSITGSINITGQYLVNGVAFSGGTNGTSGSSGSSGINGSSGTSGNSGSSGTSGSSGVSGTNGSSGTAGTSGTSPADLNRTGLITTGSISTTQSITGSLILGNTIISGSLIGNTVNNGLIKISPENTVNNLLYITSSAPVSQSNLVFNPPFLTPIASGSIVISGSNNILFSPNRGVTAGTYGYVGGSGNILSTIPTLNSASVLRPLFNSNNIIGGLTSLSFTTNSFASDPVIANNYIQGTVTINHNSGSLSMTQNIVNVAATSTAQTTNLNTQPTITLNAIIGNGIVLNHNSSSIIYTQNIGGTTITNNYSSSVAGDSNYVLVNQNLYAGSGHTTIISGSNTGLVRTFNSNFLMGRTNQINSDYNGISSGSFTGGNLVATALIGQNLIVSASNPTSTQGGTVIVGRFNATGSLQESSQDNVFIVGTGTAANNRRNALHIDSGNNVRMTGSVSISGSLSVNGNTIVGSDRNGLITTGSISTTQSITGSLILSGSQIMSGSRVSNVIPITGSLTGSYYTSSFNFNNGNIFDIQLNNGSLNTFQFSNIKQGQVSTIYIHTSGSSIVKLPELTTYVSGGLYTPTQTDAIDVLNVYGVGTGSLYIVPNKGLIAVPSTALDPDAATYIAALQANGATVSTNDQTAMSTMFASLKSNNIYTKIQALYPFYGATAATTKLNAVNPVDTNAAYRISWTGGMVYNASGVTFNSSAYGNTNLYSTVDLLDFDKHLLVYNMTDNNSSGGWDGVWSTGTGGVFGINIGTSNNVGFGLNAGPSGGGGTPSVWKGTYIQNVAGSAANSNKIYKDGSLFFTYAGAVSAFNQSIYYTLGVLNNNGSLGNGHNRTTGFYSLGKSLTDGEAATFSTIVSTYLTSTGRI